MKKSLLVLAVAMLSTSAFATNTLNTLTLDFVGGTSQTTCVIDTSLTKNNVRLKTVSINELQDANSVADSSAVDFSVHLKECPRVHFDTITHKTYDSVSVKFDNTSPNITDDGTLKRADGKGSGTRNVQVQISEQQGFINLKTGTIQQVSSLNGVTNGNHKFDFTAKFVSKEGKASAGAFESSIPVMIDYR